MFKMAFLGVFLLKGLLVSGYFAFFHGKPKQLDIKLLQDSSAQAKELNQFVQEHPSPELTALMRDLDWVIRNEYQRDIRVKRIIHQDLRSLAEMSRLYDMLERSDSESQQAYQDALSTISDRMNKLRHTKDMAIREEILLLGDLIKRNDR